MELPTARIVAPITDENPLGYIVINETDLDEGMELYAQPAASRTPKPKAA